MHQHFLEEQLARAGPHTLEGEIVLEEVDEHLPELDRNAKIDGENRDVERNSGLAEPGREEECLNFYPRSTLFSSLLSRLCYNMDI